MTLQDEVLSFVRTHPGRTDREITDRLRGQRAPQQAVNQAARALADRGVLIRRKRPDGLIGNYLGDAKPPAPRQWPPGASPKDEEGMKRGRGQAAPPGVATGPGMDLPGRLGQRARHRHRGEQGRGAVGHRGEGVRVPPGHARELLPGRLRGDAPADG